MINWKVAIGSGAVAVVLSLLTGIISGVSFGTLLLRALMWGALFCGVGIAAWMVVSRYLPELVSGAGEERAGAREAGPGEIGPNVDIVLPDENPHVDVEDDEEGGETADEATDHPGAGRAARTQSAPTQADGLIEEVEEAHRARQASAATEQEGGLPWDATDSELPDLGDEDSDGNANSEAGFRPQGLSDISGVARRGSSIDVLGHEADSEEIARAIRTAMNKDQKG